MCLVVFTGLYVDLHILNIHTCKHLHMFRFAYIAVMDFTMQVYVCQTWILFILYIVVHIHKLFYVRVHVYYSKNYNKFDTLCMCVFAAVNRASTYHSLLEMEKMFPCGSVSIRHFT